MINSIQRDLDSVSKSIATLREKKGKSKQTIKLVNKAIDFLQDTVVVLLLEKHLLYQHEVMEEDVKPKKNQKRRAWALKQMELSTKEALDYVEQNNLTRWISRVNRVLGRVEDYKENYQKAIGYYQKAIRFSKQDPEFLEEKVPRWLEYKAFLSFSILMSGKVDKGITLAKKIYQEFLKSKEGKKLRKNDYPTWAIWITGIPIRTIGGLVQLEKEVDKTEMVKWLQEAEKFIAKPATSKKWKGTIDFQFRKDELTSLKRKLSRLNS